ncbi:helix-turn-helix domain-containing protein [Enterococcus rotai]|uniref:helix-turn-helix domain-containing protein n=1 Tax=Enterococcus rotai TaxID=118060 RepID=UPI0032B350EC
MDVGCTIELIRQKKNIPIKSLIGGVVSRAHYYRITNGQSDMTVTCFFKILEQLNVSLEEFLFIKNNFKIERFKALFTDVRESFIEQDVGKLLALKEKSTLMYKETNLERYQHIALVIKLLINRLKKEEYDSFAKEYLQDYLVNLNMFTHYDLVLYTNTFFAFSKELNEAISTRILDNAKKYEQLKSFESDTVKVLSNMIFYEIELNDFKKVKEYLGYMKQVELSEHLIIEKILQKFFMGIDCLLTENIKQGKEQMKESIALLKLLEDSHYFFLEKIEEHLVSYFNL